MEIDHANHAFSIQETKLPVEGAEHEAFARVTQDRVVPATYSDSVLTN